MLTVFRLKKQYHAANERIGRTGAGLKADDVVPGSEIANIIGTLTSWEVSTKGKHTFNHSQGRQQVLGVLKRF